MDNYDEYLDEIEKLLRGCEFVIRDTLKGISHLPDNNHFERWYKDAKDDYDNAIEKWNWLIAETDFQSVALEPDDLEERYTGLKERLDQCYDDLEGMRETQDGVTEEDDLANELKNRLDLCGYEMQNLLARVGYAPDESFDSKYEVVRGLYDEVIEEWNRLTETEFCNTGCYNMYSEKVDRLGSELDEIYERRQQIIEDHEIEKKEKEREEEMVSQRQQERLEEEDDEHDEEVINDEEINDNDNDDVKSEERWYGHWYADYEYVNPYDEKTYSDTKMLGTEKNPNSKPSIEEIQYRIRQKWGWSEIRVLDIYYK